MSETRQIVKLNMLNNYLSRASTRNISILTLSLIYHNFWRGGLFLLTDYHAKSRDGRFPAKNRAKTVWPLVVLGGNYTQKKKMEWKRYEIKNFKLIYL